MDGSGGGRAAVRAAAPSWPLLAALALLVAVNLLNNSVAADLYLLWACLGIAGLVLLARADGLDRRDLGLGQVTGRVARAALLLAAGTAVVLLVGTRIPGIDTAYLDDRVVGMGAGEVAVAALVRVPVGTALLEELAFRGVLLAMLSRRYGMARGVAGSCIAFGAWHLLPSLGITSGNAALGSALGSSALASAAVGVVAAGLVGALFCLLRIRLDHLVVPWAVHTTANSLGYLLAWLMIA